MSCRTIGACAIGLCLLFEAQGIFSRLPGEVGKMVDCARGYPVFSNAYFLGAYALSSALPSEESLYVYQSQMDSLWSVEKSIRQVVSWNRMMSRTEFGNGPDKMEHAHLLIEKSFICELSEEMLSGYAARTENGPWVLLSRRNYDENRCSRHIQQKGCFPWGEAWCVFLFLGASLAVAVLLGVDTLLLAWFVYSFVVFGLLSIGCVSPVVQQVILISVVSLSVLLLIIRSLRVRRRVGVRVFDVVAVVLLFALVSCFALSHFLATPNVAGVVGGKAKWLVLNGGFSPEFWEGKGCAGDMLPAYPPCLSMLIAGVNMMAGTSGIWLEQLIGVFPFVLLYLLCCEAFPSFVQGRALLLVLLLSRTGRLVFATLYPDGLMLAFLAAGVIRLSKSQNDLLGWFFLGAGGWVKSEGVIFAFLIMLSVLVRDYGRLRLSYVILLLIIPLGWFSLSRSFGATLPDYSLACFSIDNVWRAGINIFRQCWSDVLWLVVVIVVCLFYNLGNQDWLLRVFFDIGWLIVFILVFSIVYAFGDSGRMIWHIATSAPRLIWSMSVVLFFANMTWVYQARLGRTKLGNASLTSGEMCPS